MKHIETSGETESKQIGNKSVVLCTGYALQELAGFALRWAATIGFALRVEPDKTLPAWPRQLRSYNPFVSSMLIWLMYTHVVFQCFSNVFHCVPFLDYLLPSVAISPSLLPLMHSISQSLWRISRMLKESAMPTSRPQRHSSDPWVVCFAERRLVVYHLAGDLNISKLFKIHHHRAMQLLGWHVFVCFYQSDVFVAAAKWYVLKAWYAYLSERRQRLRRFLEGAAQSLKPLA